MELPVIWETQWPKHSDRNAAAETQRSRYTNDHFKKYHHLEYSQIYPNSLYIETCHLIVHKTCQNLWNPKGVPKLWTHLKVLKIKTKCYHSNTHKITTFHQYVVFHQKLYFLTHRPICPSSRNFLPLTNPLKNALNNLGRVWPQAKSWLWASLTAIASSSVCSQGHRLFSSRFSRVSIAPSWGIDQGPQCTGQDSVTWTMPLHMLLFCLWTGAKQGLDQTTPPTNSPDSAPNHFWLIWAATVRARNIQDIIHQSMCSALSPWRKWTILFIFGL